MMPSNSAPYPKYISPTSCKVVGYLELMDGSLQHLEGTLPMRITLQHGSYTIGRGSTSDIVIKAQIEGKFIISRTHALLQIDEHDCTIKDLDSTNGVFVNNQRIEQCSLNNGDVIRFAGMSEVPVGAFLTNSNVSVMYTVHLDGAAAQGSKVAAEPPIGHAQSEIISSKNHNLVQATTDPTVQAPAEVVKANIVAQEINMMKEELHHDLKRLHSKFDNMYRLLSRANERKDNFQPSSSHQLQKSENRPEAAAIGGRGCNIEPSSLRSLLTCALCHDIMCFPIVLRCSHGFCCLCVEKSIRLGKHTCPICCDPPITSSSAKCPYHRSDHLDSVIWLSLEVEGPSNCVDVKKRYQERVAAATAELRAMGIDPDRVYEFAEGQHSEQIVGSKRKRSDGVLDPVTCDYCGSTDANHSSRDCPHRLQSSQDIGSDCGEEEDL